MSHESNKRKVIDLFENHIIKYVVKDLEVLDSIEPDPSGSGACAIPQAISTFAALDLIGYLIHPQDSKTVRMNFTDFLRNDKYFPEIKHYSTHVNFFESFRDNLRTIMVHRFSLAKYDITKSNEDYLFFEKSGRQIFNTSYFTRITVVAIMMIFNQIKDDNFIINGYSKEKTMAKIKERIEKLRDFEGNAFSPLANLPRYTTTIESTTSLG